MDEIDECPRVQHHFDGFGWGGTRVKKQAEAVVFRRVCDLYSYWVHSLQLPTLPRVYAETDAGRVAACELGGCAE